jgi:general secretion pathway protein G
MQQRKNRTAFTLVEVLIVVVIMAILAATIIPQFTDSTKEAKASTSRFNLHTLRSQIELYKAHHNGAVPDPLTDLTIATDADGATPGEFGPYVREIPANPYSNLNSVTATSGTAASPPAAATGGGWLYNATTGDIFIDHADHLAD